MKDGLLQRTRPSIRYSRAAEYIYHGPGLSPECLRKSPASPESLSPEHDLLSPDLTDLTDGIGKNDSGKNSPLGKSDAHGTGSTGSGYVEFIL
jgi:hypothetical protein